MHCTPESQSNVPGDGSHHALSRQVYCGYSKFHTPVGKTIPATLAHPCSGSFAKRDSHEMDIEFMRPSGKEGSENDLLQLRRFKLLNRSPSLKHFSPPHKLCVQGAISLSQLTGKKKITTHAKESQLLRKNARTTNAELISVKKATYLATFLTPAGH